MIRGQDSGAPIAHAQVTPLSERLNLREQVAHAVRSSLISGEMAPGEVYSVPALASRFGVSATPVREALLDLAKEGLLKPLRNKGFRVTTLSDEDLDQIYRIREMLEVSSVRDVIEVVTADDLERFREVADAIETAAVGANLTAYLNADREFHLGLLGLTGNQRLIDIVGSLRSQARLFGLAPLAAHGKLTLAVREHRQLLVLLGEGDIEGAEEVTRRHLRHTRGAWAGRDEP